MMRRGNEGGGRGGGGLGFARMVGGLEGCGGGGEGKGEGKGDVVLFYFFP